MSIIMTLAAKAVIAGAVTMHGGHAVAVQQGDTLSGIAAAHGESLAAVESANPQIADPNLIYTGQKVYLVSSGQATAVTVQASSSAQAGDHEPDGDADDPVTQPSAPSPAPQAAATTTPASQPTSTQGGSAPSSGGGLADVPGVPHAFAACVAQRESSNGANQAYNGGVYGIIRASGINVNGQSIAAQKAAFSQLYQQYGTAPWAPSDGC